MFIWASSPPSTVNVISIEKNFRMFSTTAKEKCPISRSNNSTNFANHFCFYRFLLRSNFLPGCLSFSCVLYRFNVTKFLTHSELSSEQVDSSSFITISNCFSSFSWCCCYYVIHWKKNFVHWIHFRIAMNRFSLLNRALSI